MFKKSLLFLIVLTLISCHATKSPIVTTKKGAAGNNSYSSKNKKTTKGRREIIESSSRTVVTNDNVSNYVLQYKDIAMSNMKNYGIPASIILAQGILESGAGRGDLAVSANNHFGIKCHSDWTGDSVKHDDDSSQECFRKYNKVAESYRDHALFLKGKGRYASLFELDKDDYEAWAKGLRKAGYATDPKYPDKLISYIERYNLAQYDAQVLGNKRVSKENRNTSIADRRSINEEYYEVQKGDTLYSISKKYNLLVDDLKEKNKLSDNTLFVGQKLKVN
ncbi:Flagellum-specific peptidoglycan hydrolase FlgJ [Flavobacterium glycines]|uniref:Peptidoglycan hydrolase n=1 Tax=Flavobacterium glycines TaxID=551990 RepID=A0A1B9DR54_9FLAO|nr:glucosaminidase domain-containing protein [Flavobacterium glycines]OCB72177.1 hemagglutinin [Flavobacterium glycines]GEL09629.1 hemagglutinin [Flavobacterium glycines]SDI99738.1 Flagellum-specific peptidoglycan hydrolase FlgJ [Flavobacterium glycines]